MRIWSHWVAAMCVSEVREYWPFVPGIHWPLVSYPHKGQWRRTLMFSLICSLNKRLSKQSWGWWFKMPLWRQCNDHCDIRHATLIRLFQWITILYMMLVTSLLIYTDLGDYFRNKDTKWSHKPRMEWLDLAVICSRNLIYRSGVSFVSQSSVPNHWKPGVSMMSSLSSLVVHEIVIMTTYGVNSVNKFGTRTTVGVQLAIRCWLVKHI